MAFSCHRLPHAHPPDKWLFVTWHLHGSLPHGRSPPPGKISAGKAFVWMDRYLDQACAGPLFLKQSDIANYIENNPVKASLAARAEDYPWSSANVRKGLDTIVETADTSVRATKGSTTEQLSKVPETLG